MNAINKFTGRYRFLSNFYPCPVKFDGDVYPSVEHAFQAAKTLNTDERTQIRHAISARDAKCLGRKASLRLDWEDVKVGIMLGLLRSKFDNPALSKALIATRNFELIEGNTWGDRFWGVDTLGCGQNMLGKLLMQIREELSDNFPDLVKPPFSSNVGLIAALMALSEEVVSRTKRPSWPPTIGAIKCLQCGHEWIPRGLEQTEAGKKPPEPDDGPHVCPKCKSPYWDRPRNWVW